MMHSNEMRINEMLYVFRLHVITPLGGHGQLALILCKDGDYNIKAVLSINRQG